MLNLNGSLTKAGVKYSTLWSADFKDDFFRDGLRRWLDGRVLRITIITSAAEATSSCRRGRAGRARTGGAASARTRRSWACSTRAAWACTTPSSPTNSCIRRVSSRNASASRCCTPQCSQCRREEAQAVRDWLDEKGCDSISDPNPETELTEAQILDQCRMYIAAVRLADEFGCDAIGIQYQQGLKDLAPASDLAEGLLNNVDRPPVSSRNGRELYEGEPLPHFNEVDECAGLDGLITNRVWRKLGLSLRRTRSTTSAMARNTTASSYGYSRSPAPRRRSTSSTATQARSASGSRQCTSACGGGSLKGISKPGEIVWSRVYIEDSTLKADMGRGKVVELPREETERRWQMTTPQWPIMHAVTYGVTRATR